MQILLRIVLIVKIILLSAVVHAESEGKSLTDKGYRIELIIYQQPDNDKFGNIQSSKYLNFLNSKHMATDSEATYIDKQNPSKSISSIESGLKRHSLPFIKRAWVAKLSRNAIKIPINETISDDHSPDTSLTDGISLNGNLKFSHNLYVDLAANIQFEKLVSGNVVLFDECVEKRHLKLNKLYYLDNETIGLVLRISQSDFIPPIEQHTAADMTQSAQDGLEVGLTQKDQSDPIQIAENSVQETVQDTAVLETTA
ncbi:MAG: hypothetical protein VX737_04255 [Pseudomonadota bacterium]|nr:hypothetical protein [Pseudomonadota bacterium]